MHIDTYLMHIATYLMHIDTYLMHIDAYLMHIDTYLMHIDTYSMRHSWLKYVADCVPSLQVPITVYMAAEDNFTAR